jgi:hypothetical protein
MATRQTANVDLTQVSKRELTKELVRRLQELKKRTRGGADAEADFASKSASREIDRSIAELNRLVAEFSAACW